MKIEIGGLKKHELGRSYNPSAYGINILNGLLFFHRSFLYLDNI